MISDRRMRCILAVLALWAVFLPAISALGIPTAGLVADYPLAGTGVDQSGNGNDAEVVGATTMTDRFERPAAALSLDGLDDWVSLPWTTVSPTFSFSGWLNLDLNTALTAQEKFPVYVQFEEGKGGYSLYYVEDLGNIETNDHFYSHLLTYSPVLQNLQWVGNDVPAPLTPTQWNHLAVVYDSVSLSMTTYLNGVLVGQTLNVPPPSGDHPVAGSESFLGRSYLADTTGALFKGGMDDVRLYDRALSQDEVLELFYESVLQPLTVTVDIAPGTLNLKSQGNFITVCLELSEGYSIEEVDQGTLALSRIDGVDLVPPLPAMEPASIGDCDENFVPDLSFKVDRQALIPLLSPGMVELTLNGRMLDGSPVEGSRTITVIQKGK